MIYEVNQNDYIVLSVDTNKLNTDIADQISKNISKIGINFIALPDGIKITDIIKKGDNYGW